MVSYCKKLPFSFPSSEEIKVTLDSHPHERHTAQIFQTILFIRISTAGPVSAIASTFCGLYQDVLQQRKQQSLSVIWTDTDLISSAACGCLTQKSSCIFISSFWIHLSRHRWHLGKERKSSFHKYGLLFIRSKLNVLYCENHTETSNECI